VVEEREERLPELGVWGAKRTREVGGSCGIGCFGGEVRGLCNIPCLLLLVCVVCGLDGRFCFCCCARLVGLDCDLYPLLRVELSVVSTAEEEVIMVDSNGVVAAAAAVVLFRTLVELPEEEED